MTTTETAAGGSGEALAAHAAIGGTIGRFAIVGALGQGGMGVVLSAHDPTLDRKVAIKLLRPDRWGRSEAKGRERLAREAQAMARLSHENVITVYEVGTVGEQLFVAMELVDGRTLREWRREAPRSWREVVAMFVGAGRGLAAAHQAGLVHGDFKPENVPPGGGGAALRARGGDPGERERRRSRLHRRDAPPHDALSAAAPQRPATCAGAACGRRSGD